ncbi:component of SufBCD complex [Sulfitobacter alexandrii]|uniref:Component of SufBCD complex n=1 Tax=Sulfitobacter alexandrii TaxID=1917485 RepID=A0A1J0WG68_9RHOB|nr:component of SufBCD complex [Sulfitobacter alexandrii]APE43332.1 component of SufBCD complex [Sulfitobacter alexandrii]
MDWYQTLFELIDMRSFSNLWFWIVLAVTWSTASHWVLGVPYDMVLRARRQGDQAEVDLEDMVRINVNRLLFIAQVSGLWILGFGCFGLTMLVLLGFVYGMEFAQAVFLLAFPLSLIGLLSLSTARLIQAEESGGERLRRRLTRHRLYTQIIGMVSIFVTAIWGMYQNVALGPLGG